MSFRDAIPDAVKKKILSWRLSKPLLQALIQTLVSELQTRETEEYTREVVAPVRCLILPLTILDPDSQEPHDFVFWVNSMEAPGVRIVIDCHDCMQPTTGVLMGRHLPTGPD